MGDVTKTPKRKQIKTDTAAATLTPEDSGTIFLANTGNITVTLPPAAACTGIELVFVKTTANANAVTIDGFSSETINGSANYASIDAQYDSATLVCNGTTWFIQDSQIS